MFAGSSVSLNWRMNAINTPGFARKGLVHKVLSFKDSPFNLHGFDDELEFNTQASSQWDSLVHYAHQPTGLNYNGAQPTAQALQQDFGTFDVEQTLPSLNHWHQRGGLVARGVLLDYRAWSESQGKKYDCFSDHRITTDELEEVAKWEGVQFHHGDVLIVRTGFTEELGEMDASQQEKALGTHHTVGLAGNKEVAKWHWNKHFAAVAGDAIAYESIPPLREDGSKGGIDELGELNKHILYQHTNLHSPPSMVPVPLRHEHRRAMGPESTITSLQREEALQLFDDQLSTECAWKHWLTTKCISYILNEAVSGTIYAIFTSCLPPNHIKLVRPPMSWLACPLGISPLRPWTNS